MANRLIGDLPKVGSTANDFKLVANDLSIKTLNDFKGKNLVLNIFPSIDTGTCAASVRNFNKSATDLVNTSVLCISRDLPFAQARFCGAEGIENVFMLSDFNTGQFGNDYGLNIIDGEDTNGNVLISDQQIHLGTTTLGNNIKRTFVIQFLYV